MAVRPVQRRHRLRTRGGEAVRFLKLSCTLSRTILRRADLGSRPLRRGSRLMVGPGVCIVGPLVAAAAAAVTELPVARVTASAAGSDRRDARYGGVMLRESRAIMAGYRAGVLVRPRSVCSGGTRTISRDETWAPSDASAYLIGCQLVIGRGANLTIDPGTVLRVAPGGDGQALDVAPGGSVEALGTAAHPVVFADGSSVLIAGDGSLVTKHGIFSGDASHAIRE